MSEHAPHSPEEAARLLLGLGPDDEGTETLDRVRELRTKAAAFDALQAAGDRKIPCGHTVADLIGGTETAPDGSRRPCVTKCGACLLARQGERPPSVLAEVHARLLRDAEHQRQERHVSIGEARIRADALALHLQGFAVLVKDAAALAAGGDLPGALALLRG